MKFLKILGLLVFGFAIGLLNAYMITQIYNTYVAGVTIASSVTLTALPFVAVYALILLKGFFSIDLDKNRGKEISQVVEDAITMCLTIAISWGVLYLIF